MTLVPVAAEPTSLAQVDDQCRLVEVWAEQCDDVPALRDATNKLAAIDEYLSRTSTDGRARVAAAMRRLEARIGEVIGPPQPGKRSDLEPVGHDQEVGLDARQRHDFRQMAEHPDVVDDVIEQSTDDDPPSRRKVMRAIKQHAPRAKKPALTKQIAIALHQLSEAAKCFDSIDVSALTEYADEVPVWTGNLVASLTPIQEFHNALTKEISK